jgi:hypothetical protein
MEIPEIGINRVPEREPVVEAKTAFILYIDNKGQTQITRDLNLPIIVDHSPDPSEIWRAVAEIKKSIEAEEIALLSAQLVIGNLQMMGRQQFDAQQSAEIMSKLGNVRK